MSACVLRRGALTVQVCVPGSWSDKQAMELAERSYPCGTEHGWSIRKEGSRLLAGDPERAPCSVHPDNVHIMMDA